MVRQKAVDFHGQRQKRRKEYLTFTSEWYGYDYFGAEIKHIEHIEGQYKKQTKKLVNKMDRTGRMNSWYEMDSPELPTIFHLLKQMSTNTYYI